MLLARLQATEGQLLACFRDEASTDLIQVDRVGGRQCLVLGLTWGCSREPAAPLPPTGARLPALWLHAPGLQRCCSVASISSVPAVDHLFSSNLFQPCSQALAAARVEAAAKDFQLLELQVGVVHRGAGAGRALALEGLLALVSGWGGVSCPAVASCSGSIVRRAQPPRPSPAVVLAARRASCGARRSSWSGWRRS